jgi:hypothetical protein
MDRGKNRCVTESGDLATVFFLEWLEWRGCHYCHPGANFKTFLVAMMPWPGAQRAFTVKAF